MLCSNLSFLSDYPCIIYDFHFYMWVSSYVAACMSSMDVYKGILTDVWMVFTFLLIPVISWSLFSAWLFWDSDSIKNTSGPSLYMTCTLYWCILSIMHCNFGDSMATSLLSSATNSLLSVMMHTSLVKQ